MKVGAFARYFSLPIADVLCTYDVFVGYLCRSDPVIHEIGRQAAMICWHLGYSINQIW